MKTFYAWGPIRDIYILTLKHENTMCDSKPPCPLHHEELVDRQVADGTAIGLHE